MKYTKEVLEVAVRSCVSYRQVVAALGLRWSGGIQSHLKNRIKNFGIDTNHFTGQRWNRGKISNARIGADQILVETAPGREKTFRLRRALLEIGRIEECASCKIKEWNGKKLVLEIDHINSVNTDNRQENLQFLCPNCHSQKNMHR